ncbi:hypothetical protein CsSME_00010988 [Camellia sinensis var. sinensis]
MNPIKPFCCRNKNAKFLTLPISLGMLPLIPQECMSMCSREVDRFPIVVARMPSRGLSFINNTFKSLQFTKEVRKLNSREEEDDPLVKLFPCKLRIWSNRKLPSDFGIDPINAFLPSSKVVSLEAFEIDSGIIPVSLFSPRSRILRLGSQSPILDGRLLDKLFSVSDIP